MGQLPREKLEHKTPPGLSTEQRTERKKPAADHPPPGTGSQSRKDWKGATADLERLYLPNCKQAPLLRLLGVLDSHHLPHKGRQRSTQKTEQQRQKRRQVAVTVLAKHLSYLDLGRAQNAGPTKSEPLRATREPSLSGLDRRGACRLGPVSDGSQQSNVVPEWCKPCAWPCPAWLRHCEHMPVLFAYSIPTFPQCD